MFGLKRGELGSIVLILFVTALVSGLILSNSETFTGLITSMEKNTSYTIPEVNDTAIPNETIIPNETVIPPETPPEEQPPETSPPQPAMTIQAETPPEQQYGILADSNFSACINITSSGVYNLTQNITGAPTNASPTFVGKTCIKVNASDVLIDCRRFAIKKDSTTGNTSGILLVGPLTNITVQNCSEISLYSTGIYVSSTNNSIFRNNYLLSNTGTLLGGIYLDNSFFNNITNNIFSKNTYGIYLAAGSSNNMLDNNSAYNNTQYSFYFINLSNSNILSNNNATTNTLGGIYINNSNYNTISSNIVYKGTNGVQILSNSQFNNLSNNIISNCTATGIVVTSSSNNTVTNNNISNSTTTGILIQTSSNNNTFTNNVLFTNPTGVNVNTASSYNTFTNNSAYIQTTQGFIIQASSNNNTFSDNTACQSGSYNFYLNSASNNTFTNNIACNTTAATAYGFYLSTSSQNNTFINNTAYGNTGATAHGFYIITTSYYNTFINNTAFNNSGVNSSGFFFLTISGTNGSGNNASYNGHYGFLFKTSSGNSFSDNIAENNKKADVWAGDINLAVPTLDSYCNNVMQNTTGYGGKQIIFTNQSGNWQNIDAAEVVLCNADGSVLNNITLVNSGPYVSNGLFIIRSDNNNISNITTSSNLYGISASTSNKNMFTNINVSNNANGTYFVSSSHNVIRDSTFSSNTDKDLILQTTSTNNTFINTSDNISKESILSGGQLFKKWYYQAYVNTTNGSSVSNVTILAYDTFNAKQLNLSTNSTGYTPLTVILEYMTNFSGTYYYSNYQISAQNPPYYETSNHTYNVSDKLSNLDVITLDPDTTFPVIYFVSPTLDSGLLAVKIPVNITASDNNLKNRTIFLYNATDLINSASSSYVVFRNLPEGMYYYNATACDYAGNCNSTELRNITISYPNITWVDKNYNATNSGNHTWLFDAFSTIQEGIDALIFNGTVYVYNNTYIENVVINNNISLIGLDFPTIQSATIFDSIVVKSGNVFISGFNITGGTNGIFIGGGSIINITNNSIAGNTYGITNLIPFSNFVDSPTPIFGGAGDGENRTYNPVVIKINSTYHVWYGDGANTRHGVSNYSDFSDMVFPANIVTGLNATAPYKSKVYYDPSGWNISGVNYSQPLIMYYTDSSNYSKAPRIAVSDDGDNWTDIGPVSGTFGGIYTFAVSYEGNNVWKAYTDAFDAKINFYNSTNGQNWTSQKNDTLIRSNLSKQQSWENNGVTSVGAVGPAIFKWNDIYFLTYSSGIYRNDETIGFAYSFDGLNFIKSGSNPGFSALDGIDWRKGRVYTSYLMNDNGTWILYYTGANETSGTNTTTYQTGMATINELPTVYASKNWWGASSGPNSSDVVGNVSYCPFCLDSACTIFSCTGAFPSNLVVWDDSDLGETLICGDTINFYANYTNSSDEPITTATVTAYPPFSAPVTLSWNGSLYTGSTTLPSYYFGDSFNYTVNATNDEGFDNQSQDHTANITLGCGCQLDSSITPDVQMTENLKNETNGDVCTGNGLTILDDNLTIDCNRYNITGSGGSYGIYDNGAGHSNLTIANCNLDSFSYGLYFTSYLNDSFIENVSANNMVSYGVFLYNSNNNLVKNFVGDNSGNPIYLYNSYNNRMININTSSNAAYGIYTYFSGNNSIDSFYSVNDAYPLYIYYTADNSSISDVFIYNFSGAGVSIYSPYVYVNNVTINSSDANFWYLWGDNSFSNFTSNVSFFLMDNIADTDVILLPADDMFFDCMGFFIGGGSYIYSNGKRNLTIANCNVADASYGVYLFYVNDSIVENVSTNNMVYGVYLANSNNNSVKNFVGNNSNYPVYLTDSNDNLFVDINTSNNGYGLYFTQTSNNSVDGYDSVNDSAPLYIYPYNYDITFSNMRLNVSPNNANDNFMFIGYSNGTISNLSLMNDYGISTFDSVNITYPDSTQTNTYFNISTNYINLNSAYVLALNTSANLTFFNLGTISGAVALRNDAPCGGYCSNFGTDGTNYWFDVSSFTNYSVGSGGFNSSNLTIWDNTNASSPAYVAPVVCGQDIKFYANYTNPLGNPITDSIGAVNLSIPGFADFEMTYNSGDGLWEKTIGYSEINSTYVGKFEYFIIANNTAGYDNKTLGTNATQTLGCDCTLDSAYTPTVEMTGNLVDGSGNPVCSGNGLNIGSDNIVINCQGFNISGSSEGIASSGYRNITVENCIINDFQRGIHFIDINNSNILNVSMNNISVTGIWFDWADNNTIDSFVCNNCVDPIDMYSGSINNNRIMNVNTSNSTYAYAIHLTSGSNNSLTNYHSYNDTSTYVIQVDSSDNISLSDINIINQSGSNYAVYLTGTNISISNVYMESFNPQFWNAPPADLVSSNITMHMNGNSDAFSGLISMPSNSILDCKDYNITGSIAWGDIWSVSDVRNITIANCNIYNTGRGVSLNNVDDIKIVNITINNCYYDGLWLQGSSSNIEVSDVFINNTNTASNARGLRFEGSVHNNITLYNLSIFISNLSTNYYIDYIHANVTAYNLTFLSGNANIKFDTIVINDSTTFDTTAGKVDLSQNYIYVDSDSLQPLNVSANLTFFGITGITSPVAYRDGAPCTEGCSPVGNVSTTYWFNVSHFTNYSIGEALVDTSSSLVVNDSTHAGVTICGEDIYIIANYTNASGSPIDNVSGLVNVTVLGSTHVMDYNSSTGLWNFTVPGSMLMTFYDDVPYVVNATSGVYDNHTTSTINASQTLGCGCVLNGNVNPIVMSGDLVNAAGGYSCSGDGFYINTSNIIINCSNHWLNGSGYGIGSMNSQSNVTITNCKLGDWQYGFSLGSVNYSNINSLYMHTQKGMYLSNANYNNFSSIDINIIAPAAMIEGIYLTGSSNNSFSDINISNHFRGIYATGSSVWNKFTNILLNCNPTTCSSSLEINSAGNVFNNTIINSSNGNFIYSAVSDLVGYNITLLNANGSLHYDFLNATSPFSTAASLIIANNSIRLNSSAAPDLNTSANLTFFGVTGITSPYAYRNDAPCVEGCSPVGNSGSNYWFNVSHFTNYSIGEAPVIPGGSNLDVWDTSDQLMLTCNMGYCIFANYSNATSGESINDSVGNVTFDQIGGQFTYNSGSKLWSKCFGPSPIYFNNFTTPQINATSNVFANLTDPGELVVQTLGCGCVINGNPHIGPVVMNDTLYNLTGGTVCPGDGLILQSPPFPSLFNISLDCANYPIMGSGNGNGINISVTESTVISNCSIINFSTGLRAAGTGSVNVTNFETRDNAEYGVFVNLTTDSYYKHINISSTSDKFLFVNASRPISFKNVSLLNANGKVFYDSFDTTSSVQINTLNNIEISNNLIRVESSNANASALNTSANLTFFNPGAFLHPKPLLDGADCPEDVCSNVSHSGSNYWFNVSHFTNYSISDTVVVSGCPFYVNTPSESMSENLDCNGTAIIFNRSNAVFDCGIYNITGNRSGYGINASGQRNVTVKNCRISKFDSGVYFFETNDSFIHNVTSFDNSAAGNNSDSSAIWIKNSRNNTVSSCFVTDNMDQGIEIHNSSYTLLLNNNISRAFNPGNTYDGLAISSSPHTTMVNNTIAGHNRNLIIGGGSLSEFDTLDINTSNTINGKPIYYLVGNQSSTVPTDAGYVGLVSTVNMTVENLVMKNNEIGLLLAGDVNSTVRNLTLGTADRINGNFYGVASFFSEGGVLENITVYNGLQHGYSIGIMLISSQNMTFRNVNISDNLVPYSSGIYIGGNSDFNNFTGITLKNNSGPSSIMGCEILFSQTMFYQPLSLGNPESNNFWNTTITGSSCYVAYTENVSNSNNFTNFTIGYDYQHGLVNWDFVNVTNATLSTSNLIVQPDFVSLNDSDAGAVQFNRSANITLNVPGCIDPDNFSVYYKSGFPQSRSDILTGSIYPTTKACIDTASMRFSVLGFSGFSVNGSVTGCVNLSDASTFGARVINSSNMYSIETSVTLCRDTYHLNALPPNNITLLVNKSGIVFDCNGSTIIGNGSGTAIYMSTDEMNDTVIENCVLKNYTLGIGKDGRANNMVLRNNLFSDFVSLDNYPYGINLGTNGYWDNKYSDIFILNNTFKNFRSTSIIDAGMIAIFFGDSMNDSHDIMIANNTVQNFSVDAGASSQGKIIGIGIGIGGPLVTIYNITIMNNTIRDLYLRNGTSSLVLGVIFGNVINSTISNNYVNNLSAAQSTADTHVMGIASASSSDNIIIRNNRVSNISEVGIYIGGSSNHTVINNTADNNMFGFGLRENSQDNTFINNTAFNNAFGGFYSENSRGSKFINCNASNNLMLGFAFMTNDMDGSVINSTASNNEFVGIYYGTDLLGRNLTLINDVVQENGFIDLMVEPAMAEQCNILVENVTGSGNRPINYTNDTVNWNNFEASEIILCNADNSNLTNITVKGSNTLLNNMLFLDFADNVTVKDSASFENALGYAVDDSSRVVFLNNNATNNGIGLESSNLANSTFANTNIYSEFNSFMFAGNSNLTSDNMTFENSEGIIYYPFFDLNGSDCDASSGNVEISHNLIRVESPNVPDLNTAADLLFKNINNFKEPYALRNSQKCSNTYCLASSYDASANEFYLNVSSFTTYSVASTSPPPAKVSKGGSAYSPCSWNCGDWGDCMAGMQTRKCQGDSNSTYCNTLYRDDVRKCEIKVVEAKPAQPTAPPAEKPPVTVPPSNLGGMIEKTAEEVKKVQESPMPTTSPLWLLVLAIPLFSLIVIFRPVTFSEESMLRYMFVNRMEIDGMSSVPRVAGIYKQLFMEEGKTLTGIRLDEKQRALADSLMSEFQLNDETAELIAAADSAATMRPIVQTSAKIPDALRARFKRIRFVNLAEQYPKELLPGFQLQPQPEQQPVNLPA